jgi:hypothetical protein
MQHKDLLPILTEQKQVTLEILVALVLALQKLFLLFQPVEQ